MKNIFIILIILLIQNFSSSLDSIYLEKISKLNDELIKYKVEKEWLLSNLKDNRFRIYSEIEKIFTNNAESKVSSREKNYEWYKSQFGLDIKIELGKKFIAGNIANLQNVERKNGIHYELIVAILGMETNFADDIHKGNFYVFNSLVSQYLLMPRREKFTIDELVNLYFFSKKINKDTFYFTGSFAGACGWAQFLPSSLNDYFIDFGGNDYNIDIYAVDDSIASIENYLFKHGLNAANINLYESRYAAVFKYNPSYPYVKAVLYIYDGLRLERIVENIKK